LEDGFKYWLADGEEVEEEAEDASSDAEAVEQVVWQVSAIEG